MRRQKRYALSFLTISNALRITYFPLFMTDSTTLQPPPYRALLARRRSHPASSQTDSCSFSFRTQHPRPQQFSSTSPHFLLPPYSSTKHEILNSHSIVRHRPSLDYLPPRRPFTTIQYPLLHLLWWFDRSLLLRGRGSSEKRSGNM